MPKTNWCDATGLCKDHLKIPRDKMPQIEGDVKADFLHELRRRGVSVVHEEVEVSKLKATQKEIFSEKVEGMAESGAAALTVKPLLVSSDYYILDGHHRWAAILSLDASYLVPIRKIHMLMEELLKEAQEFEGAEFRDLKDRKAVLAYLVAQRYLRLTL